MEKRGQITFFLFIIGISILTMIIFYYERHTVTEESLKRNIIASSGAETAQIRLFAESCLDSSLKQSISRVLSHGGYIDPRGNPAFGEDGCREYLFYNSTYIPYLLLGDDDHNLLNKSDIERRLSRYSLIIFESCFNLTFFDTRGYDFLVPDIKYYTLGFNFSKASVNYSDINIYPSVSIDYETVSSYLTYPVLIKKGRSSSLIYEFFADSDFDFNKLYSHVETIITESKSRYPAPYNLSRDCSRFFPFKVYNSGKIIKIRPPYSLEFGRASYFIFAVNNSNIVGQCS